MGHTQACQANAEAEIPVKCRRCHSKTKSLAGLCLACRWEKRRRLLKRQKPRWVGRAGKWLERRQNALPVGV